MGDKKALAEVALFLRMPVPDASDLVFDLQTVLGAQIKILRFAPGTTVLLAEASCGQALPPETFGAVPTVRYVLPCSGSDCSQLYPFEETPVEWRGDELARLEQSHLVGGWLLRDGKALCPACGGPHG